ncbi:UNVERIFIED_ORG: protocatechuate 3,4-dioxygenase alpha subunit [Xanthobacter viscosus]|jgi:protocatechuate 3,4-dioxygenase alpha subunit|uniref:Protocatechuate 3,4-dioxygenase subunit alpha n=1 Tax=Xanthobacter autotrophicus TaxID=280 RepID=A0A6C1KSW1_XANAU|nr:protocatechuate 3,4-dioxygenase subunit alpha [Xanthobacter autotrophicus]TLX43426.1 protocatechuate 3,4-dioxygenase subunit alpha [Xanthobacter autotrophicus]
MPVAYLKETPSQTAGPYVHIGTLPAVAGLPVRSQENLSVLASGSVPGERIRITGVVWDGAGHPVKDALLELWQADAAGRHDNPDFPGFGRAAADFATGAFSFETVKPGALPWRDGRTQAPHVCLLIFARGINIHLHTRMYFSDEAEANAADPMLKSIEHAGRRTTLVGERGTEDGVVTYRFDIHLQGENETVFFDV